MGEVADNHKDLDGQNLQCNDDIVKSSKSPCQPGEQPDQEEEKLSSAEPTKDLESVAANEEGANEEGAAAEYPHIEEQRNEVERQVNENMAGSAEATNELESVAASEAGAAAAPADYLQIYDTVNEAEEQDEDKHLVASAEPKTEIESSAASETAAKYPQIEHLGDEAQQPANETSVPPYERLSDEPKEGAAAESPQIEDPVHEVEEQEEDKYTVATADSVNESDSMAASAAAEAAAYPQIEDEGDEAGQPADETLVPPYERLLEEPREQAAAVQSRGYEAVTPLEATAAANGHEKQLEAELPVSAALSVEEEPREAIFPNGVAHHHDLMKPVDSTSEKPLPVYPEPKIEYFCTPHQNLTSDAWKIFFYHMLPFTTVPHFLVMGLLWGLYRNWGWSALLFYTTIMILLTSSPPVYSKRFRAAVSGHFYGLLARYVPSAQYAVPDKPFLENRPYIFACHPHGRMFYSTIIFCQLHATWAKNICKTGDLFMTAAGMFFYVPILRNLFYLVGVIPVEKADIVAKLRQKDHVTILIGGVKEVLLGTENNVDRLYLKRRKGFCKIAIQENAGVVPVYFFNENQMFKHNSNSFLRFWERLNKYFKVGVPFMRGRFFILPMPFRNPLLIAVGEPLFPREGETVDDFHERYMQALRGLFDKYVPYSPDPNHKLIIQ